MKLSIFFDIHSFHDASVVAMEYDHETNCLTLSVELSEYTEIVDNSITPINNQRQLLLEDAEIVSVDPHLTQDELLGLFLTREAEVLHARVKPQRINEGKEDLELAMILFDYQSRTQDFYVVTIKASDAKWLF